MDSREVRTEATYYVQQYILAASWPCHVVQKDIYLL